MRVSVIGLYNPVLWEYSRVYRWMLGLGRAIELFLTIARFVLISVPLRAIRGEREPDLAPAGDILIEGTRIDHRSDYGSISYEREYWEKERLDVSPGSKGRFANVRFGMGPVVRILMEEMGPTFIKLGQFLGMRPELPLSLQRDLQKLQERVPPFSYRELRKIMKKEYGMPLEEMFSYFEEKPFAAASLGQVYQARLRKEGTDVAVKVQRPYLEATVTIDLLVIDVLLKVLTWVLPELRKKTDVGIFMSGFGGCLRKEIDFRREATSQQALRDWYANSPHFKAHVKVPEVHWDYISGKVLVSELIRGMYRLDTEEACKALRETTSIGVERWDVNNWPLLNMGACLTLDVWESNIFYMDSHLGNIYFQPEEKKWVVLDFGMVEILTDEERDLIVDLMAGMWLFRDPHIMAKAALAVHEYAGGKRKKVNIPALKEKLASCLERHFEGAEAQIQKRGGPDMTADLLTSLATQGLKLPAFLWYFVKACSGLVRVGLLVDPLYDGEQMVCWYMGDNLKRRIVRALESSDVTDVTKAINEMVPVLSGVSERDKVIPGLVKMLAAQDPESRAAQVRAKGSAERVIRIS